MVPPLQSAQGLQGRDLPIGRTGGSSGHQAGTMDGQRTYGMDRGTAVHFWGGLCGPHVKLGALTGSRAPRTRVTAPARSLQQVPSAAQCPHELPPAQLYQSALWHQPQCKPGRLGDHRGPSRSQPQAPDKQEAPVLCARWLLMTSSPACSAPGGARPASLVGTPGRGLVRAGTRLGNTRTSPGRPVSYRDLGDVLLVTRPDNDEFGGERG